MSPTKGHLVAYSLLARHSREADRCCLCNAALAEERRSYVCRPCSRPDGAAFQEWTPAGQRADNHGDCQNTRVDTSPYLNPLGNLRIPFDAPARYRWWQGGQSPAATARELGASGEEVARLITPTEARRWR